MKEEEKKWLWWVIIILVVAVVVLWVKVDELSKGKVGSTHYEEQSSVIEDKLEKIESEIERLENDKVDNINFDERVSDAIDYYLQ